MGTPLEKEYQDLLSLTKKYLVQEFKSDSWLVTSPENYAYFKKLAQKSKGQQASQKELPQPIGKTIQAPVLQTTSAPLLPTPIKKPDLSIQPQIKTEPPTPVIEPIAVKTPPPEAYRSKAFELEPMKGADPIDLNDIRQIVETHFHDFPYLNPLQHEEAVVCILAPDLIPEHLAFLQNVAKAITQLKAPTIVIPESKKHLIPASIRLCLSNYEELANRAVVCLKMENIHVYLRDPKQKAVLWQQIRSTIASLLTPTS